MATRENFFYRKFIGNRILRIYPAFVLSLMLIVGVLAAQKGFKFDGIQFIGNLLFLNGFPGLGIVPYNQPTWSLAFEFVYYLLLPLLLILIGGRMRISPLRVALLGGTAWLALSFASPYYIRFMMFFGGAFMAAHSDLALRRHAANFSDWTAVLIYAAAGALYSFEVDLRLFIPAFLIGTYLLALRTLYGEGMLRRIFSSGPLRMLGNLSYSFYLVHAAVITYVIWKIGFLFNWQLKVPLIGRAAYFVTTLCFSFFASAVFATALFVIAERPYFARKKT